MEQEILATLRMTSAKRSRTRRLPEALLKLTPDSIALLAAAHETNEPSWGVMKRLAFMFSPLLFAAADPSRLEILKKIEQIQSLTPGQSANLRSLFEGSNILGQGNPKASIHLNSQEECIDKNPELLIPNRTFASICKAPFMVPIFDTKKQKPSDAKACIDQFEFPNIPCEYPVTWVKAQEAAMICEAVGKRLCDAHEWEGACAGEMAEQPYVFIDSASQHTKARHEINAHRKIQWSYGAKEDQTLCATNSKKSDGCDQALIAGKGVWDHCGSNTYPAGFFPHCKSPLEVYDLHGNAAEHMNLPFKPEEQTSLGGSGWTEMKGSWFVFQKVKAHKDDCFWRAPFWHGSKIRDPKSHSNYHLGFRCCKNL